ncbi:MAG: iron-containing alcohol dehydrogenase [Eubacteriales bacterium]|nr:iron-containing alcohol dehydrogenase [Eubacteriales bacterium]
MVSFEYYNPVRVIFGCGESSRIGEIAHDFGKKALIVTYEQHAFLKHILERTEEILLNKDMVVFNCFNITANPMISQINTGIEICRQENIDVIIGIGGGSVMDASKAIGIGTFYSGDVWDMFMSRHDCIRDVKPQKSLPTIMIPTLPATSSEMNNIAVATNDSTCEKSYICHNIVYPDISIIDPEITCLLPKYQSACGAVDAISHLLEAYFNCVPDTPLQDRLQEGTILTIMELIPKILNDPYNKTLRANMQWASTISWNGWLQAGINPGSPMHQIGHVISARFGVTHGATLGIIMPSFFRYVLNHRVERFAQFGRRIFNLNGSDVDIAKKAIDMFESFIASVGVQTRLSQVGIIESDIKAIAEDVERVSCDEKGHLPSVPPVGKKDIENILRLAL